MQWCKYICEQSTVKKKWKDAPVAKNNREAAVKLIANLLSFGKSQIKQAETYINQVNRWYIFYEKSVKRRLCVM